MATLRKSAEQLIESYGKPYDSVLYERAKDLILNEVAKFVRQSSERNGIDDYFISSFISPLIPVDTIDNCQVQLGCTIYRTTNKVPEPVRIKNDIPFIFVGTADGTRTFRYTKSFEVSLLKYLRFTSKKIAYVYINQYIYIFNTNLLDWIRIDAPFVIPFSASCNNNNCFTDDMEIPISADMLNDILKSISSSNLLLRVPSEQSNITVNKEE